jgi:hypothetical protein
MKHLILFALLITGISKAQTFTTFELINNKGEKVVDIERINEVKFSDNEITISRKRGFARLTFVEKLEPFEYSGLVYKNHYIVETIFGTKIRVLFTDNIIIRLMSDGTVSIIRR